MLSIVYSAVCVSLPRPQKTLFYLTLYLYTARTINKNPLPNLSLIIRDFRRHNKGLSHRNCNKVTANALLALCLMYVDGFRLIWMLDIKTKVMAVESSHLKQALKSKLSILFKTQKLPFSICKIAQNMLYKCVGTFIMGFFYIILHAFLCRIKYSYFNKASNKFNY